MMSLIELAVFSVVCLANMPADKVFEIISEQNVWVGTPTVEKSRAELDFSTEHYRYMDDITDIIEKTVPKLPYDTLAKYIYDGNLFMEVFAIEKSTASDSCSFISYDDKRNYKLDPIKLTDGGSYYITVNMSLPDVYGSFKFKYGGFNFVCDHYIDGFFRKLNGISFLTPRYRALYQLELYYDEDFADYDKYSDEELDDMIDDPGYFGDWRFVVIDGELKNAIYYGCSCEYDFISDTDINCYKFFRQTPYPKSRYSTADQWQSRLIPYSKDGHCIDSYVNFKELK